MPAGLCFSEAYDSGCPRREEHIDIIPHPHREDSIHREWLVGLASRRVSVPISERVDPPRSTGSTLRTAAHVAAPAKGPEARDSLDAGTHQDPLRAKFSPCVWRRSADNRVDRSYVPGDETVYLTTNDDGVWSPAERVRTPEREDGRPIYVIASPNAPGLRRNRGSGSRPRKG